MTYNFNIDYTMTKLLYFMFEELKIGGKYLT